MPFVGERAYVPLMDERAHCSGVLRVPLIGERGVNRLFEIGDCCAQQGIVR